MKLSLYCAKNMDLFSLLCYPNSVKQFCFKDLSEVISLASLNIVLVEPEIPQNTGNIARTCACTGANLHIVKPMGFTVTDRNLKRSGLDYWHFLNITYYENLDEFFEKNRDGSFFYFTTKAQKRHSDTTYLSPFRERDKGSSGGTPYKASGAVRAYTHDGRLQKP